MIVTCRSNTTSVQCKVAVCCSIAIDRNACFVKCDRIGTKKITVDRYLGTSVFQVAERYITVNDELICIELCYRNVAFIISALVAYKVEGLSVDGSRTTRKESTIDSNSSGIRIVDVKNICIDSVTAYILISGS